MGAGGKNGEVLVYGESVVEVMVAGVLDCWFAGVLDCLLLESLR